MNTYYSNPSFPEGHERRITFERKLINQASFDIAYESVTNLSLWNCFFEDGGLGFLRAFPSLKNLIINGSRELRRIDDISHLHVLEDLSISHCDLATLAGLEFCSNLKRLFLSSLDVSDLSLLDGIRIKRLSVTNLPIDDLPSELPSLKSLRVENCKNLEHIPYYPSLLVLSCTSTKIRSLRKYSGSQLKGLTVEKTRLRRLPDLPRTQMISAPENRITSLVPYDPNFQSEACSINLRENRLTSLDGLENYPNLRLFIGKNNSISDITPLGKHCGSNIIHHLDISHNQVTKIPRLPRSFRADQIVWNFSHNLIEDIRRFVPIFQNEGTQLRVENNPLSFESLLILYENKQMGRFYSISEKDVKRIKRYRKKRTSEED